VTHHENPESETESEKHEAVLLVGVVRVVDQQGIVVEEDALGLLERDPVLAPVQSALALIPFEPKR
jgi:hypothetical protein